MKKLRSILLLSFAILATSCMQNNSNTQKKLVVDNKLVISDTLPWSVRMAETILLKFPNLEMIEKKEGPIWNYTSGLVCLAMQILSEEKNDKRYYAYTKKYADELINDQGVIHGYEMEKYNIDKINSGKILFRLYNDTKDERYKTALLTLREQLKGHPRISEGGYWHKKRYPYQMWLDGLFMGLPFYAQYGKEFNEPENFDDVASQILLMEQKARDEKTGLLYHGWDESKEQKWANKETGCSKHFWGRGVGWYAMAVVDVLDFLPDDHPKRDELIAVFNRLAEAIVNCQDEETGVWYQVLDQGTREGNYLEGSASTMFAYSLLKAINKGYIDKTKYIDAAKKGFIGITENLMKIEADGSLVLTPNCAGAGLGGDPYRDGTYEYYINEDLRDNDAKAMGPFILASMEYEFLTK